MRTIQLLLTVWFALHTAQTQAQTNTLEVWMDPDCQLTADGKTVTRLTVYQKDPNADYTTFNMTLTVPKGTKINRVRSGRDYVNDIELSERATNTHSIACNMPDERTVKIICMSSLLQNLYPDDADGNEYYPLFTIGLVADPSTYNGKYRVEMTGCRFVKNEGEGLSHTDLDHTEYTEFTVRGGTEFPGVDYAVSAVRCGTLIQPFDSAIPAGMQVYTCDGISEEENVLQLSAVEAIAANTPYIVAAEAGNYHFEGEYRALKEAYSTPFMTGVFEEMPVPAGAYVMQNHTATTGLGFYRVGGTEVKISPYRCYLNVRSGGGKVMKISPGDLTGLSQPAAGAGKRVNVYSAEGKLLRSGVRMDGALDSLAPGVYIIDDRKYIKE